MPHNERHRIYGPDHSGLEHWLPQLLQTNDSGFPSGTYAHSFGLEGLVKLGAVSDAATLEGFMMETILPLMRQFELPMLRLAYHAALDADVARLIKLAERYGAMKTTCELRQASLRLGTQRLQLLLQVRPLPLLQQLERERDAGRFLSHATIVYGVQTAAGGTPLTAALIGFYYQNIAALVSAAVKLIRLGPIAAQQLITRCLGVIEPVLAAVEALEEDDIGCFHPLLDIASAQHETAHTRIFIS